MKWFLSLPLANKMLLFCILCASYFYFWNVSNTLQFQGDQGRDASIVANIFRYNDLVFIGPVTSVGNMYLGPLYYYFMAPFLFLSYPSPVGPAYAIGLLAILTIICIFVISKKMFNEKTAIIATVIYSFSSTIATYARFSWNPNPAPLPAVLMIFFTYKAWTKDPRYWILVSFCFSILIQLHYLTLLTLPAAGIFWLASAYKTYTSKKYKPFIVSTLLALVVFILSLTPLVLFDLKHDNLNARAFINLFTKETVFESEKVLSASGKALETVQDMHGRALTIMFDVFVGKDYIINTLFLSFEILICLFIFKKASKKEQKPFIVVTIYILMAIIGTALYKSNVYNHYILFILPAAVIFHGYVLSKITTTKVSMIGLLLICLMYIVINQKEMPLKTVGWTIHDMSEVSQQIANLVTENEKYNIVLLSESKDSYGQNYRYFLSTIPAKAPLNPERNGEAQKLIVINEEKKEMDILNVPIYEIVSFGANNAETYKNPNGPDIIVLTK